MRKRSKKRVPQDIRAWIGVKDTSSDTLTVASKKTVRWTSGSRRDWNTQILNKASTKEVRRIFTKSAMSVLGRDTAAFNKNLLLKLAYDAYQLDKSESLPKYKNYCLFSGRGRTYNRQMHIARHNLRKLVGVGAISGFIK